jgi:hypothetical protein
MPARNRTKSKRWGGANPGGGKVNPGWAGMNPHSGGGGAIPASRAVDSKQRRLLVRSRIERMDRRSVAVRVSV